MRCEGLVTAAREDETSLLAESWKDDHIEALSIDDRALRLAQHRLARNIDLLHGTVEELEELALESHIDVWLSVLTIDLVELSATSRATRGVLNVGVGRAEELLEDLEVLALVDIA